jgi:predicted regulator of Ras-like GTPase activity (Roadblock/LC7/MglB family)
MKGSLQDMAVVDLIQLFCQDRKTANVQIRNGKQKVDLFFKNGNVVHAAMADEVGEDVVYQVMHWEDGSFEDRPDVEPPTISITRGWTGLLLEGARRYDEAINEEVAPVAAGQERQSGQGLFSSLLARLGQQAEGGQISVQIAPEVSRAWAATGGIVASSKIAEEVQILMVDLGAQIDGFYGAAVADMNGNILLNALGRGAEVNEMVNMASRYVKTAGDAAAKLGMGVLVDNLLTTETTYLLTNFIMGKNNYLLIMADKKAANLARMRHAARLCVSRLGELGLDRIVMESDR